MIDKTQKELIAYDTKLYYWLKDKGLIKKRAGLKRLKMVKIACKKQSRA